MPMPEPWTVDWMSFAMGVGAAYVGSLAFGLAFAKALSRCNSLVWTDDHRRN